MTGQELSVKQLSDQLFYEQIKKDGMILMRRIAMCGFEFKTILSNGVIKDGNLIGKKN